MVGWWVKVKKKGKDVPEILRRTEPREWSYSRKGRFTSGERFPRNRVDRRLRGPRVGLDVVTQKKKKCTYRESKSDRPARILTELPQLYYNSSKNYRYYYKSQE
jgi:hypothetical protein